MSLTATLLFGQPIRLPEGVRQPPHYVLKSAPLVTVVEVKYEKRRSIREANIALVLSAIEQGVDTIKAIAEHIGISKATVLKAVNRLQDREMVEYTIGRTAGGIRQYYWKVVR